MNANHCPVCGMKVTQASKFSIEYHMSHYFFCSPVCKETFQRDPDTYINMKMARIHEKNEELEFIRKETIECLSRAAEYKDNETGKHTARLASYSQQLAVLVGLETSHIELIRDAAPMHDVGKIGIPESILLKPGKLNADERMIVEQHSEIGAEILGINSRSKLMKMAVTIAISHHEKWNGGGYPKGIKNENIPIEGRIVALCDVFDALISERPYKKPWGLDKIKELMIEEAGEHFDPKLTRLFLQNFSGFCDIHNRLRDENG